jgi:hypothetical protein
MKKIFTISLILVAFPLIAAGDIIVFKDGMIIDVSEAWEKNGEVKCKIGGIVFSYPKEDVERIGKGQKKGMKILVPEKIIQQQGTVKQKKETATPQKIIAKKATEPERVEIPTFKIVINEDDDNSPIYIKRRRTLLVKKGLSKPQIKNLLLSYEKKLRNELKARQAKYKLIIIWVYDDLEKAKSGIAGWTGMISNDQESGKLSDSPKLLIR